jgi:eukaryotic-like serine/threonine-protein kinase
LKTSFLPLDSSNAVATAERAHEKETAAAHEADAAIREALFGHASEARQRAAAALRLSTGRDVQYGVAVALAFAGDATRAQALTDDLTKRFPQDTIVQAHYLTTCPSPKCYPSRMPFKSAIFKKDETEGALPR